MSEDRIIDLQDAPEIKIVSDESHNITIVFTEDVCFEKGNKISLWTSAIADEVRKRTIEECMSLIGEEIPSKQLNDLARKKHTRLFQYGRGANQAMREAKERIGHLLKS